MQTISEYFPLTKRFGKCTVNNFGIYVNNIEEDANTRHTNIKEVYPHFDFVYFYCSGVNPDFAGMDWSSMIIVIAKYKGKYYMVGIVEDQWTI